eukprot:5612748-Amphidinium_carterae.1
MSLCGLRTRTASNFPGGSELAQRIAVVVDGQIALLHKSCIRNSTSAHPHASASAQMLGKVGFPTLKAE